jgi:hypothetical protein
MPSMRHDGLFEHLRFGREERLKSGALTAPSSVALLTATGWQT